MSFLSSRVSASLILWFLVVLAILFFNFPKLYSPENDESYFLLGASCLNPNGCFIYRDLFDVKLPGIFLMFYPIEKIISHNFEMIVLLRLMFIVTSNILLLALVRKIYDNHTALLTSAIFLFLQFSPFFQLYVLRPETFLAALSLFLIYVALYLRKNKPLLCFCFLILGLFFMIKIIYIFIAVPFTLFLFSKERHIEKKWLAAFFASFLVLPILSLIIFAVPGALNGFLANITKYYPLVSPFTYFSSLGYTMLLLFVITPILLIIPAFVFFCKPETDKTLLLKGMGAATFFVAITPISSSMIYTRLFGAFIPFLSIAFSIVVLHVIRSFAERHPNQWALLTGFVLLLTILTFIIEVLPSLDNSFYGVEISQLSHSELMSLCRFIDANTQKNETILAIPINPELYYFCDRRPASPLIFFALGGFSQTDKNIVNEVSDTVQNSSSLKYVLLFDRDNSSSKTLYAQLVVDKHLIFYKRVEPFEVYERAVPRALTPSGEG